ncbi:hypothetical protein PC112_g24258 [Phytophthora cactorum]|nr:hypothetical protein PC112_g24258 [Phytophthora cactorum]
MKHSRSPSEIPVRDRSAQFWTSAEDQICEEPSVDQVSIHADEFLFFAMMLCGIFNWFEESKAKSSFPGRSSTRSYSSALRLRAPFSVVDAELAMVVNSRPKSQTSYARDVQDDATCEAHELCRSGIS